MHGEALTGVVLSLKVLILKGRGRRWVVGCRGRWVVGWRVVEELLVVRSEDGHVACVRGLSDVYPAELAGVVLLLEDGWGGHRHFRDGCTGRTEVSLQCAMDGGC